MFVFSYPFFFFIFFLSNFFFVFSKDLDSYYVSPYKFNIDLHHYCVPDEVIISARVNPLFTQGYVSTPIMNMNDQGDIYFIDIEFGILVKVLKDSKDTILLNNCNSTNTLNEGPTQLFNFRSISSFSHINGSNFLITDSRNGRIKIFNEENVVNILGTGITPSYDYNSEYYSTPKTIPFSSLKSISFNSDGLMATYDYNTHITRLIDFDNNTANAIMGNAFDIPSNFVYDTSETYPFQYLSIDSITYNYLDQLVFFDMYKNTLYKYYNNTLYSQLKFTFPIYSLSVDYLTNDIFFINYSGNTGYRYFNSNNTYESITQATSTSDILNNNSLKESLPKFSTYYGKIRYIFSDNNDNVYISYPYSFGKIVGNDVVQVFGSSITHHYRNYTSTGVGLNINNPLTPVFDVDFSKIFYLEVSDGFKNLKYISLLFNNITILYSNLDSFDSFYSMDKILLKSVSLNEYNLLQTDKTNPEIVYLTTNYAVSRVNLSDDTIQTILMSNPRGTIGYSIPGVLAKENLGVSTTTAKAYRDEIYYLELGSLYKINSTGYIESTNFSLCPIVDQCNYNSYLTDIAFNEDILYISSYNSIFEYNLVSYQNRSISSVSQYISPSIIIDPLPISGVVFRSIMSITYDKVLNSLFISDYLSYRFYQLSLDTNIIEKFIGNDYYLIPSSGDIMFGVSPMITPLNSLKSLNFYNDNLYSIINNYSIIGFNSTMVYNLTDIYYNQFNYTNGISNINFFSDSYYNLKVHKDFLYFTSLSGLIKYDLINNNATILLGGGNLRYSNYMTSDIPLTSYYFYISELTFANDNLFFIENSNLFKYVNETYARPYYSSIYNSPSLKNANGSLIYDTYLGSSYSLESKGENLYVWTNYGLARINTTDDKVYFIGGSGQNYFDSSNPEPVNFLDIYLSYTNIISSKKFNILYIIDYNKIYKLDLETNLISKLNQSFVPPIGQENRYSHLQDNFQLSYLSSGTIDDEENIIIHDSNYGRTFKFNITSNETTIIAGNGFNPLKNEQNIDVTTKTKLSDTNVGVVYNFKYDKVSGDYYYSDVYHNKLIRVFNKEYNISCEISSFLLFEGFSKPNFMHCTSNEHIHTRIDVFLNPIVESNPEFGYYYLNESPYTFSHVNYTYKSFDYNGFSSFIDIDKLTPGLYALSISSSSQNVNVNFTVNPAYDFNYIPGSPILNSTILFVQETPSFLYTFSDVLIADKSYQEVGQVIMKDELLDYSFELYSLPSKYLTDEADFVSIDLKLIDFNSFFTLDNNTISMHSARYSGLFALKPVSEKTIYAFNSLYLPNIYNVPDDITFFKIIDPSPSISSAILSSDGLNMTINFDYAVQFNSSIFNCAEVFNFSCAESSLCSFNENFNKIMVAFDHNNSRQDECLYYFNITTIENSLTSNCNWSQIKYEIPSISCENSEYFSSYVSSSIITEFESILQKPEIIINIDEEVTNCNDFFTLDFSNSTGAILNKWYSVSFFSNSSDLNDFLMESIDMAEISSIVLIPSNLLENLSITSIYIELCNAKESCSNSTITFFVTPFFATFFNGESSIDFSSSRVIEIDSATNITYCSIQDDKVEINYDWTIYHQDQLSNDLIGEFSESKSSIILDKSKVSFGSDYKIYLTVTFSNPLTRYSVKRFAQIDIHLFPPEIIVNLELISPSLINSSVKNLGSLNDSINIHFIQDVVDGTLPINIIANINYTEAIYSSYWNIYPSLNLSTITNTTLYTPLPPITTSIPNLNSFNFPFSLPANVLTEGVSYLFTLSTISTSNRGVDSYISYALRVNDHPSGGSFIVVPSTGFEMQDFFKYEYDNWFDLDLPLSYIFFYKDYTENIILLGNSSANDSFQFPAGNGSNNQVPCILEVRDSLEFSTFSTFNITVYPFVINNEDKESLVNDILNLNLNTSTPSEVSKSLQIAAQILNSVDCSLAPDCLTLNRKSCSTIANTCGTCLANYFGTKGNSNEECLSKDQYQEKISQENNSNSESPTFNKTCLNGCSSHGECRFFSLSTQHEVNSCPQSSLLCEAKCICHLGYASAPDCSITEVEAELKKESRKKMLEMNRDILAYVDNISAESLNEIIQSFNQITSVSYELSPASLNIISEFSTNLVDIISSSSTINPSILVNLAPSLDSAAQVISQSNDLEASYLTNLIDISSKISESISKTLSDSDDAYVIKTDFLVITSFPKFNKGSRRNKQRSRYLLDENFSSDCESSSVSISTLGNAFSVESFSSLSIPVCSSFTLSSIVLSSQSYSNELNLISDVINLDFSSSPCGASTDECRVQIEIPIPNFEAFLEENSPSIVEEVETICSRGQFGFSYARCSDGYIIEEQCEGIEISKIHTCPTINMTPICDSPSLLTSNSNSKLCTLISYTETTAYCSCFLADPSNISVNNINLLEENSSKKVKTNYGAMLISVRNDFVSTIISAKDLDEGVLARGWPTILTLGCLIIFISIFMYSSYRADKTAIQKTQTEEIMHKFRMKTPIQIAKKLSSKVTDERLAKSLQTGRSFKSSFFQLADEALPNILHSSSLGSRVKEELKRHHRWLAVLTFFSKDIPRLLRATSLCTNVILLLFAQSITYNLRQGDDGTCETYDTETSCLEPSSDFSTGSSKCYWEVGTTMDGSPDPYGRGVCSFVEPDKDYNVIIFISIISALISTPFAVMIDYLISHILSAPNLEDISPQDQEDDMNFDRRVYDSSDSKNKSEEISSPMMFSSHIGKKDLVVSIINKQTDEEYLQLINEIKQYRLEISSNEKELKNFDNAWGLDSDGNPFDQKELTLLNKILCQSKKTSIKELIKSDLYSIIYDEKKERKLFSQFNSERLKSKRLLYLFQRDLMPGLSGLILDSKNNRENFEIPSVSKRKKQLGWSFLILVNAGMIFYIFLFAVSGEKSRQFAWAKSFAIWLACEIFFVSTVLVIITHIFLPIFLMSDLNNVKKNLYESLMKYNQILKNSKNEHYKLLSENDETDHFTDINNELSERKNFNAASYLFLSHRLAKVYSEIRIAKIILSFSSPWPRQSFKRINDVKKSYTSRTFSVLSGAIITMGIHFLTQLLSVPLAIQDMIIQMVLAIVSGYLVLLHVKLYLLFPILIILPSLLIFAIVHFILSNKKVDTTTKFSDDKIDLPEGELSLNYIKRQKNKKTSSLKNNNQSILSNNSKNQIELKSHAEYLEDGVEVVEDIYDDYFSENLDDSDLSNFSLENSFSDDNYSSSYSNNK